MKPDSALRSSRLALVWLFVSCSTRVPNPCSLRPWRTAVLLKPQTQQYLFTKMHLFTKRTKRLNWFRDLGLPHSEAFASATRSTQNQLSLEKHLFVVEVLFLVNEQRWSQIDGPCHRDFAFHGAHTNCTAFEVLQLTINSHGILRVLEKG